MSKPKINVSRAQCAYINQEEVHINNDSHTYYLLVGQINNINSDELGWVYRAIMGLDDVDTLQYKSLTISPSKGIPAEDMREYECDVDLHGALSDYKGCYYWITGGCPIDVYVDGIKCTANKSGSYTIYAVSTDYISWLKNEVDNNFGIDSYKKALADNKKYNDDLNAYNNCMTQYTVYKKQLDAYNTAKAKYDSDKKLYDEYLVKKQKYDKYMSDLQIYNSVMDTYNKELEQYNKDMEQYKKDLEEYNKTHNSGGNTEDSETNTDNNDSKTE